MTWRASAGELSLAALCFLLCACGEQAEPASEPDVPAPVSAAPHVDPPPAELREVTGMVTVAGARASRGAPVEAERAIEVGESARAALQLRDGGRITLDEGAHAWVVDESAAQLLLVRGAAHAVQPPAGSSPRPPLRLVTPSATVEIGQAGEAYVATFEGGASWVVALGGEIAVSNGESDARQRLRTVGLTAGQAVAVSNRIAEPTEAPRRLEAAREAASALAVAPPEPEAERLARDVESEAQRLDTALRLLETETRRGRELTSQHGAAVREGQRDEAQRLQRQLVTHSQALYRLRQLATARWERLRAQWLRLGLIGQQPARDPVALRRERVVGLLGL